jgi:hypothetical protein
MGSTRIEPASEGDANSRQMENRVAAWEAPLDDELFHIQIWMYKKLFYETACVFIDLRNVTSDQAGEYLDNRLLE